MKKSTNPNNTTLKNGTNIKVILIICSIVIALTIAAFFIIEKCSTLDLITDTITIEYGQSYEPKAEDFINSKTDVTFEGSMPNEQGKTYASIGNYVFKISAKNKKSREVTIKVQDTVAPVMDETNPKEVEFVKECKEDITEKFKATDLSQVVITFEDANVDYTKVGEYQANVFATDKSGNVTNQEVKVKVVEPTITLDKTSIELYVDDSTTISATVKGKDNTVVWTSSDESVATVDNGKIIAKKEGTATVDAEANGTKTSITVAVMRKNSSANNSSTKNQSQGKNNSSSSSSLSSSTNNTSSNNNFSSSSSNGGSTSQNGCASGKHSMVTGSIGKWFNNRNEVQNYVSSVIKPWNDKLANGIITQEEYNKNAPSGYEAWSCSNCGKWTGNFKYR